MYKLEGLIETVYLLTMQFLPTNNQWKAMLLYYRVNKLQKILVTALRRRKRLTVAGFFLLNMKTDQKTLFLYNIFIDLLFWTDNRLIWYLVKCTSSVRFKENKFKTPQNTNPDLLDLFVFLKTFWSLENLLTFWSRWRWDNCPWKVDIYNRKLIWHVIRSNSKSILLLGPFLVVEI